MKSVTTMPVPARVSVVINYCSIESAFIEAMLEQCSVFAHQIVVSYSDTLHDGRSDDTTVIDALIQRYRNNNSKHANTNNIKFVKYDVDPSTPALQRRGVVNRPSAYWHNLARWTAVTNLDSPDFAKEDWVFVLDADEIPEGGKVLEWLRQYELRQDTVYKFNNYWYFKKPTFRATTHEDSILLVQKKYLNSMDFVFGDDERDHIVRKCREAGCPSVRQVNGLHGLPMFHHFSWVRSPRGMLDKLLTWAHRDDLFRNVDPVKLVDHVFSDERVNDVVHGYAYDEVDNLFGLNI